jgi:CRP-like cAMP-binding protein
MPESDQLQSRKETARGIHLCQNIETPGSILSKVTRRLETVSPLRVYPGTVELYRQGSASEEVFFIERGLVKLTRSEPDGQELIVDLRFPGSFLGGASVVARERNPLTAVTLTKSHLRRVEAKVFCRLMQTEVGFSWHVHQLTCHEISHHISRITQLGCLSARHRLEQLFRQLITAGGAEGLRRNVTLRVPLKHWEFAQLIAVTPAYLSRLFNRLELEGVIRRDGKAFAIPDPRRLWRWEGA